MQLSKQGFETLKKLEGYRAKSYLDQAGLKTIGYGHLEEGESQKLAGFLTQKQAQDLLRQDSAKFAKFVTKKVSVELAQNQFDALVLFCFNVGERNFARSSLLKKLNAGNYEAVSLELMRWVNCAGKKNHGLVMRRAKEVQIWQNGYQNEAIAQDYISSQPKITIGTILSCISAPLIAFFDLLRHSQILQIGLFILAFGSSIYLILHFWLHRHELAR